MKSKDEEGENAQEKGRKRKKDTSDKDEINPQRAKLRTQKFVLQMEKEHFLERKGGGGGCFRRAVQAYFFYVETHLSSNYLGLTMSANKFYNLKSDNLDTFFEFFDIKPIF